ncbi:MAG: YkgJ family cysteine cluster protein [Chitinispirillaceae bacterium]
MNKDSSPSVKPNLVISPESQAIHDRIVESIESLAESNLFPEDGAFVRQYQSIMQLLGKYQDAVISGTDYHVSCGKGCSTCCYHWVEDVYSFEARMIAAYIRETTPQEVDRIIAICRKDEEQLIMIQEVVDHTISLNRKEIEAEGIDPVDLLLASFYQLKRPCPLLSTDGICTIYPLRPLTCRIYVNLSDPHFCDPRYIHDEEIRTYLLDMQESANALLDDLHGRFDTFEGDTGLRSLLIKCLG